MKTETRLHITEEELSIMKKIAGSGKLRSKFAIRLLVIINRAEGKTLESISESLGISLSSVIRYVKRFNREGMESLLKDKTRKPGKAPVSVEMKDRICKIACTEKPKNTTHWSVRSLAKQVGIGKSTVNGILRERGIQPHLTETFPCSSDETGEEKLRDVVGLYMNPPDNAIILCVDEQSPIRALERTPPLLPLREHLPARQTADYERPGTTTLFAALNVLPGEVLGKCKDPHKSEDYIAFLKIIDKSCEAGKTLHIIADTYSTHKTKNVKAYLASVPGRFQTHVIPTHSSWVNLVERWFAEITNKRIRRESWGSVKALVRAIEDYIKNWNKDSKPFTWTKSADGSIHCIHKTKTAYLN